VYSHPNQGAQQAGIHPVGYHVLPDAVPLVVAAPAPEQIALVERSVVEKGGDLDPHRAAVGIGEGRTRRPPQSPGAATQLADPQPRVLAGAAGTVCAEFDEEVAGLCAGIGRNELVEDQVPPGQRNATPPPTLDAQAVQRLRCAVAVVVSAALDPQCAVGGVQFQGAPGGT